MSSTSKFAFQKTNYLIMLAGIVVLIIGFYIMTIDSEPYGFGFLGLTLGPIIVFLGFVMQFVAIFYKGKSVENQEEPSNK
jgi:ABC-type multidrug transport system fused ATPase/permease subunit